jgi:AcrR family transcriptional regulator
MARAALNLPVSEVPEPTDRILQILSDSARLYATAGHDGTSMRDIANACGISKSLLYHHFADKDEIFARIALGSMRELCEFVAARIPQDASASHRVRALMTSTAGIFPALPLGLDCFYRLILERP